MKPENEKDTVHVRFTHSETAFRIINGQEVTDEEWEKRLESNQKKEENYGITRLAEKNAL